MTSDPVNGPLEPMLATPCAEPFDSPDYYFEPKWDGYRAVAFLGDATVLQSRRLKDITPEFPSLGRLHAALRHRSATLDGEVVVIRRGKPSFQALQRGGGRPVYVAFDLLSVNGRGLLDVPLGERKSMLDAALHDTGEVALSPYFRGRGRALFREMAGRGLEGIVAKRVDSPYLPGRRTSYWLKIKVRRVADCVIGAVSRGVGHFVGSLALGLYSAEELVYVGRAGTGLNERERVALWESLTRADGPPFHFPSGRIPTELRGAVWVVPDTVCEISFAEVTDDLALRHASYVRLRRDKSPAECTLDQLTGV
ncbi:MAG: non-homologous end-joining DNA ligase [Firmicutes bacterium]|jgi:DNA ligase D-like protein (predicted ligase)|nr:non-homologous end-joining DNA ligase [Bacillota bacterium]